MLPLVYTFYRFGRSTWKTFRDPEFEVLATLAVVVLGIGTFAYHSIEGWGYIDSLYFSVTTLTTVGYGDLAPRTELGRLFTIPYILVGLGILLGFVNAVAMHTIEDGKREGVIIPKRFTLRHKATGQTEEVEAVDVVS
ncbi:MAG: potassium channel family protein [Candidatus Pacebacteria bacterium]|nr:potassium channel family protein [Candidatus Paceibacterota bacterium]